METTKKYLTIKRSSYGTNETSKEDIEYRIFPQDGYVATIKDGSINHKEI